jgi:RNA-directed DNA polymerase
MKKFTKSYNNIITTENLLHAWQEFVLGKKNRVDVVAFQYRLMNNICDLHQELADKTYRHGAYHAFNISDPKPRNIHKATVRDRLLHHLLHAEMYPYFDKKFFYDSYSCRINKGTHKSMDRFRDFGRIVSKNDTRACWVLECDIRKFFANIDHTILKDMLTRYIDDADLLQLLGHIICSFSTQGRTDVGLPLGNLTSQLLVNVYMNEFDHFMKRTLKVTHYIRYADDFAILHEDPTYLASLIPQISDFLGTKLKLSLHPDKVFIKTLASGVDFLGWVHFPHHRVLRTATKRRMFANPGIYAADEAVVNSYRGLLSHGNGFHLIQKIEAYSKKHCV